MKKTIIFLLVVLICVMLPVFSNIYAVESALLNVGNQNVTSVEDVDGSVTTIIAHANGDSSPFGNINFSPKETGVYTIDVTGMVGSMYPNQDLCFEITNSRNEQIRLASYYDPNTSKYVTYTDRTNRNSTSIDVILSEGETYTIKLSENKATPNSTLGTYVAQPTEYGYDVTTESDYLVSFELNEEASDQPSYQSDIPASRVSDTGANVSQDSLEELEYDIPIGENEDDTDSDDDGEGSILEEYLLNPLEETICELLLSIGDFFINLMNSIIGEEVTVMALIYNKIDAVNPNFFDSAVSGAGITANLKSSINEWYNVFKLLAISIYVVVLLAIGVNILFASTSGGMGKAKELLKEWIKGLICLIFIPYVIKYAFLINEAIVNLLRDSAGVEDYQVGTTFGNSSNEWSAEEIEFRSPEFVSNYTGSVEFGSDDATRNYLKRIPTYQQNFDLMRIMRGYAGATKKIVYAIIWFILIGQLISFIVQYYKRYFMIAFLIVMFPLICIFNSIEIARGRKGKLVGPWMREVLTNIFIQSVHAVIYTIITAVCISVVREDIQSSATLNWIIIILAINFVSEGEKILRKLVGAIGNTFDDTGRAGQGIKGAIQKTKNNITKLFAG